MIITTSGLRIEDETVGHGEEARRGRLVSVHYAGWLLEADRPRMRGRKFDSSRDRDRPFRFVLGAGNVIAGWDEGVEGMRVGGRRTLVIPPSLGYGEHGAGDAIPPNAGLVFEIELLAA